MEQYLDYALGQNSSNRMPLFVKPVEKLSAKEVMWLMRDHLRGHADGHAQRHRGRRPQHAVPLAPDELSSVDGQEYLNERAIATQQTGFWFASDRPGAGCPTPSGASLWFGVDDSGTSCLTPIYTSRRPACRNVSAKGTAT